MAGRADVPPCSKPPSSRGPVARAGWPKILSIRTRTKRAHGRDVEAHAYTKDEGPAYWNQGDLPLMVQTPKEGRKVFTGQSTPMPLHDVPHVSETQPRVRRSLFARIDSWPNRFSSTS